MPVTRRSFLGFVSALYAGGIPQALAQADWPARPVRVVSPYAAGGANDISARLLAEHIGRELKQQFFIENKAGAGTRIANEAVAKAQPDGYTFLYAAAPYATAEALFGTLRYERKDLVPVAMAALAPLFLIVNANAPYKTVQEFVAHAKAAPDGVTFGSPGAGSQPHLAAELLFKDAGFKGINVVFRGDAPAYTELIAGRIDATITAITSALPFVEEGKLRVLGVASAQRSSLYPQAPTLREQGFERIVAAGWYGVLAPAATPAPIVERLQAAIVRALADPDVKQRFLKLGLEPRGSTAAEFGAFIDEETAKWGKIIREAGLKGEQ
ncbi:MAG: tripartite tricarboxylate transporter substrate binding protein [Hyphomicrobiaceae bacterium]|nr:tripartite tricarboxylate transporter substrate binding protein [Hyphomicrobiaceae bacterium]